MDKTFLLKLFLTRWVILVALSLVVLEVVRLFWKIEGGYAWMRATGIVDAACRLVFTPVLLVGLTAFHVWQYQDHVSWPAAIAFGLFSGVGTAAITLGYSRLRKLEPSGIHAVVTILLFPLAVKLIEPLLLKWLL